MDKVNKNKSLLNGKSDGKHFSGIREALACSKVEQKIEFSNCGVNEVRTMNIFVKSKPGRHLDDEKQSQDRNTFSIQRSRAKCSVDRSLALTLYVSRLFGVAPVTFEKKHNSIFVNVSPKMYAYSYLLLFILHIAIISGVVLDFYVEPDRTVRLRSAIASLTWLIELLVVSALMTVGVYNGPERMNCMIHCLNVIEKVNSGIHKHLPGKRIEQTVLIIGILFLSIGYSLYVFDFYSFVHEALLDEKDMKVLCLYLSFYLEFMATLPLELQFMDIVMKIVLTQKAINNALMDLVCQIDTQDQQKNIVECNCPSNKVNFELHENFLNTTKGDKVSDSKISKKDIELFHYLTLSYGAVCDVMKQINDSNSVVLILLILSFFLHLVVSPYYLISYWVSTKHSRASSGMVHLFISLFHAINMMIIVEPAHRNTEEMETTQVLLGQLARRIKSPNEPLFHELDIFYKQIILNPISFTPMGICSLTRSIITTILGGVTTYLVIILQFRALDKQIW